MLHSVAVRFAPFVFRAVNDPVLLFGDALAEARRHFQPIAMRLALLAVLAAVIAATGGLLIFHLSTGAERLDLTDLPVVAAIGLVSALIGAIFATGLAQHMSRPIRSVARAAARYAAGEGVLWVEGGRTTGEVRELIDNFNAMVGAIEAYEQERRVHAAGITHELRTPLAILKGRLHGIDDGVVSAVPDEAERLLRQVDHALRVVDDIGSLDPGARANGIAPQIVDIADILRPVVDDLNVVVAAHGIRLVARYEAAPVIADPGRLGQVFTNLLTNAVKHSRSGDVVAIDVHTVGAAVEVQVVDQGPGFDAADAKHLFAPFWRAAANGPAGRPGTGMGLALAARLIAAHGGRITAQNRGDRSGACFLVSLPLAGKLGPAVPSARVRNGDRAAARSSEAAGAYIAAATGR